MGLLQLGARGGVRAGIASRAGGFGHVLLLLPHLHCRRLLGLVGRRGRGTAVFPVLKLLVDALVFSLGDLLDGLAWLVSLAFAMLLALDRKKREKNLLPG